MKPNLHHCVFTALCALGFATNLPAQGTAFTYQGRLNERGALADGTYDLRFTIYDNATGGTSPLDPVTIRDLSISNGLFTVELDFGALGSTPRWLEIEVRPARGRDYDVLSPRQSLTTTPRAHYALQAGDVLNPVPDALIPATVARLGGNNVFTGQVSFVVPPRWEGPPFTVNTSAQVPNLNADYLDGLDSSAFWKIIGNAGTSPDFHFLGTTDNQPLEFRVNNQPALRLTYATSQFFTSPNIVGGFTENSVAPGFVGGFIAAGGLPSDGLFPSNPNKVNNHFGSIGGGFGNTAGGFASHVGGGRFNFCGGGDSLIVGGYGNTNPIAGFATIGGGRYNSVNGSWGTVPGGDNNTVNGRYGFAAGRRAKALHDGAFVWADSQEVDFTSTAFDQFCVRASGGVRLSPQTSLFWGGSQLWPDQGGAIELGNSLQNGVTPYIDFHYGLGSAQDFNVRLANDANGQLTLSGSQQITGNLGFGAQTRQMLNLWGAAYGIGVQSSAAYFRTDGEFFRYRRGNHSDAFSDPGAGGTQLMRLGSTGNLVIAGTLSQGSDRNIKQDFAPVDAHEVLEKVVALPIHSWAYTNDPSCRHVGPVAQDFHAAFDLNGNDDKHIATVDADGVALAAIQGLNQKLEEDLRGRRAEIDALKTQNRALEERLIALERLMARDR
jgi:hypothetical protein